MAQTYATLALAKRGRFIIFMHQIHTLNGNPPSASQSSKGKEIRLVTQMRKMSTCEQIKLTKSIALHTLFPFFFMLSDGVMQKLV